MTLAAYEIEPIIIDYLHSTIEEIAGACSNEGIDFKGEVFPEDFIAAGVAMTTGGLIPRDAGVSIVPY